jgi:3'(2'), 5'-bisphosphate nucleotidase
MIDAADHELAAELATEAGRRLLEFQGTWTGDERDLGDAGDHLSNEYLMAQLRSRRPDDAILSEEDVDSDARLSAVRVWIIDPLDGTREYRERGRDDWAVHVALCLDGHAVCGAVALPALGITLATPIVQPGRHAGKMTVVVSRSRPPVEAQVVADALGAELVELGSAGAKTMSVVLGHNDVYVHSGGQYEWDSAAPVAVAHAAGLHVSRIDGSEIVYNNTNPYLPDLLVCRAELAAQVLAALNPA